MAQTTSDPSTAPDVRGNLALASLQDNPALVPLQDSPVMMAYAEYASRANPPSSLGDVYEMVAPPPLALARAPRSAAGLPSAGPQASTALASGVLPPPTRGGPNSERVAHATSHLQLKGRCRTTPASNPETSSYPSDPHRRSTPSADPSALESLGATGATDPIGTNGDDHSTLVSAPADGGRASPPTPPAEAAINNAKYRPEVYEDDLSSWGAWAKLARARLLHFSPSWFSVTMGTGMLGNLCLLSPWSNVHMVLRWPGLVLVIVNCGLLSMFTIMMLVRYTIFPSVLRLTLTHSQQSLFLGAPAMSLTTTLTGLLATGQAFHVGGLSTSSLSSSSAASSSSSGEAYPNVGIVIAAASLWFLSMVVSMAVVTGVPWTMMTWQTHTLQQTTAMLLLPIVPAITIGNAGGPFADVLHQAALGQRYFAQNVTLADRFDNLAWTIVVFSYALLGIGVLLAMSILVLYFQRLLLFKSPPREIILSVMLPLGPCGQGADGLIHLGACAAALLPRSSPSGISPDLPIGIALHACGLLGGLMLWGLGIWWSFLAVLTIARERFRGHLPFNMGWWSMTFPTGSLCMATARLALTLDSNALRIMFAIMVGINACIWVVCIVPTVGGYLSGELLIAPCISNVPLRP